MRHSRFLTIIALAAFASGPASALAAPSRKPETVVTVLQEKIAALVTDNLDRRVYDRVEIRGLRLGQDSKLNEMSVRQTLEHEMPMDYRELTFRVLLSGPEKRKASYRLSCTLGMSGPKGARNFNIMWCNAINTGTGKPAEAFELEHFWKEDRVTFQDRGVASDGPPTLDTPAEPIEASPPPRPNVSTRTGDGPRFPKDL
jgi:hypothetical protein